VAVAERLAHLLKRSCQVNLHHRDIPRTEAVKLA
jgi:hypothetical protein